MTTPVPEVTAMARAIRQALDDEPDIYGSGVAEKLMKLPEAYANCVRFVSSIEFLDLITAAQSALTTEGRGDAKKAGSVGEETGWLIERDGEWYAAAPYTKWTLDHAIDGGLWRKNWTKDASNALRFARKVDAETLIKFYGFQNTTATDHKWLSLPRPIGHLYREYDIHKFGPGAKSPIPASETSADDARYVVKMALREDGGLRVWSDTHPGLILGGTDPAKVAAGIWPALHALETFGTPEFARPSETSATPAEGVDLEGVARIIHDWKGYRSPTFDELYAEWKQDGSPPYGFDPEPNGDFTLQYRWSGSNFAVAMEQAEAIAALFPTPPALPDELVGLSEKATAGTWSAVRDDGWGIRCESGDPPWLAIMPGKPVDQDNAAFIAGLVNWFRTLLNKDPTS